MFKTRAVSDLNSFKNVPLVFYFNRILNNALKKEKAVKITKATLVKYYANRLNNPSAQPQPFSSFYITFVTEQVPATGK